MTENLIALFEDLYKHNFKLQIAKIKFFVTEVKFLGIVFSKTGRKIDPDKVKSIENFPEPTTVKSLQEVLGMLAFLSSFIPNFSTRLYPCYQLLKGKDRGKNGPIEMTVEARDALEDVKEHLMNETILYNIDYTKPVYCSVDASQVGCGAFLYQVSIYDKTPENEKLLLDLLGLIPDKSKFTNYLLPGVACGKQTPLITDYLRDDKVFSEHEEMKPLLDPSKTMTEKLEYLKSKIVHVRPIAFYSKLFSQSQIRCYLAMEKELLSLMFTLTHFRDIFESVPLVYVLTDSQPILWLLRH
jgi:hypothetical protein